MYFDRETFGVDRLVAGSPMCRSRCDARRCQGARQIEAVIAEFPLSDDAKARLIEFFKHPKDYLAGKSKAEKIAYLKKISYRDYLRKDAGLGDEAVKYFDGATKDLLAMGPDIVPALEALGSRYPGFARPRTQGQEEAGIDEPYIYHFPDGNASIARLLIRSLIPGGARRATPWTTWCSPTSTTPSSMSTARPFACA